MPGTDCGATPLLNLACCFVGFADMLYHDRPEDVRAKFERYGEIRDIYLPRDYYTQ